MFSSAMFLSKDKKKMQKMIALSKTSDGMEESN